MNEDQKKTDRRTGVRLFAEKYSKLPPGDIAKLRRADTPSTLGCFWVCYKPANENAGNTLSIARLEQMLPLMGNWHQQKNIDENNKPITLGGLINPHYKSAKLKLSRIENLFGENRYEGLLQELYSLSDLTRSSEIDFGQLYWDFWQIEHGEKDQVFRRWARVIFS